MSDHNRVTETKENAQKQCKAAPVYIEPDDYFPAEIREKVKIGEFNDSVEAAEESPEERQKRLAVLQCDDAITWNKRIIESADAPEDAKAAARDIIKRAERVKRDILSGKTRIYPED